MGKGGGPRLGSAEAPPWKALRAKVGSRALDGHTRNYVGAACHLLRPTWVRIRSRGTFWGDLRSPAEAGQCEL